jgi:hypothetical protein
LLDTHIPLVDSADAADEITGQAADIFEKISQAQLSNIMAFVPIILALACVGSLLAIKVLLLFLK